MEIVLLCLEYSFLSRCILPGNPSKSFMDNECLCIISDSFTLEAICLPCFSRWKVAVAKELNDPERVINREIKLKELYLDANGPNFLLSKLPQLRTPEEWAAMKSFTGK